MNKKDNIEEFLRENRPVVKDDPTFLLETNRRLKSVEGIKAEVDRQRVHGSMVLIVTLVIGIVIGAFAVFVGYICPFNLENIGESAFAGIILFITTWKQYFFILLAALSVSLALLLSRTRHAGV
jgi:membrane-anchored glycerophosphoryl diester phosphodiesterase (GDPDase)